MNPGIAIVGLACRYPDAASLAELWENVLAQRRAFRRMPAERLNMADYYSPDLHAPDRTYCATAAVIEDYEFDRVRYRVSGSTYRTADLVHWLALDIAARSLADAGFVDGEGLPRESTSVFLGNTLTGEFSRAATMRLRWPYVRRIVGAALAGRGSSPEERAGLLREIETAYKRPFPEVGEESLAGGLSNTIAGRISNHFDLKGGGYTVDGACASSLLAVATACSGLVAGDCDVAIAGGVDLSLDPFEIIGFAKTGALAPERMRVYDARSAGFWPGEGCGFAVLMRQQDAIDQARRTYAVIRGWGISSDGSGGITRPEVEGQILAFQRAYRRAGFGPDSVAYFEGHGTGTAVGDATELRVICRARREAGAHTPAAIGSIKANIGHTKAAAGIAGLIKAAMALHHQVVPPATGCETPHAEMGSGLRALARPEVWPASQPLRASVSAMGFGGINSHLALEGAAAARKQKLTEREQLLAGTPGDAELFLFGSTEQMARAAELAEGLSLAEMTDLAADCASQAPASLRCAVVAASPEELVRKLSQARSREAPGRAPRIGFLFPGQGSQNSAAATEIAQPAVVRDSLDAWRRLRAHGIEASVAIGHSLGELTALCWAGVLDEDAVLRLAQTRGRLMAAVDGPKGAMAGIGAAAGTVERLIGGEPVVIAGLNSARQTVVSGEAEAVQRVAERARAAGHNAVLLAVSHAFHSPLVAPAAGPLAQYLAGETLHAPERCMVSTITGRALCAADDIRELLHRQITAPVRFREALEAAGEVDLWIEVGPGRVLSGLASATVGAPVVPVESGTASQRGFLEAVAAAFEMGAPVRAEALFAGRFARPFKGRHKFFVNPCELAPGDLGQVVELPLQPDVQPGTVSAAASPLAVVRALVAEWAELPEGAVSEDARLLADLHLNSIVVAQIATEAARRLGMTPPAAPLDYAGLSVSGMAWALETARALPSPREPAVPNGVDAWVRAFVPRLVPRAFPSAPKTAMGGEWLFFGPTEGTVRAALESSVAQLPAAGGVVLCLPPRPDERHAGVMLEAARAAMRLRAPARFVVVQHGGGAAALARTIFLEAREFPVLVVDLPAGDPLAVARVAAEASGSRQYVEACYDAAGNRYEPALQVARAATEPLPLGGDDVVLVSGGAKGIGAECAIEAARASGCKLALLGTSAVEASQEVSANLERMRALGLRFAYFQADVTDAAAVAAACRGASEALGPITAIIHCAGLNRPRPVESMEEGAFHETVAVKTHGLRNLLAGAGEWRLKLVVAFGSIIARMGLPGEADYATANEWLERDLANWSAAHPECRCLTLEFSVWSGAGMGERVARLDELRRVGISPISIDEGIRAFREALRQAGPGATTLVVTGRFGAPPTVQFDAPDLPLLRFLERAPVHYPGVELVAEADLSVANDPYLDDHIFSESRLFPGVMALEAMAQAAMSLTGSTRPPRFEPVRFTRPVIVPAEGSLTIRLAALVRGEGEVEVCLRSAETGFQTDHFRATCRFGDSQPASALEPAGDTEAVVLDPALDLYGGLLFQEGRFRRLLGYRRLRATECVAEAGAEEARAWFNRYLPQTLVLGDAGIRDTAIHAIQACIPHARVLPGGAAEIAFYSPTATGTYRIHARERSRVGDLLVYDLAIVTPQGQVVEQWKGLELRIVSAAALPSHWPPALLAPYLERRIGEIAPRSHVSIKLGINGNGSGNGLLHRTDGKPQHPSGFISRSHAGNLTLAATSPEAVGCDCEPVAPRTAAAWGDLLGPGGFALAKLVARETREELDPAATRVWCALECARKAGARSDIGIVLATPDDPNSISSGWVVLAAGAARIATLVAPVAGFRELLAFAVMVGE